MADRKDISKAILATVAVAGMMTLVVVAPNTLQLLKYADFDKRQKRNRHYYIKQVADRLVEQGLLVRVTNSRGVKCLKLTSQGERQLEKLELLDYQIKKPRRWDGRYHVVAFDIKEWKRVTRDELRRLLSQIGFVKLQDSVWVYPYDCAELVTLLKSHFKLGKEVLYMTVDSLENDRWLRNEFGLS